MADPGGLPTDAQLMSGKRKRVVLTIRQKLHIVRLLDAGRMPKELAVEFGIGEQTVRDLRKSREQLERFAAASGDASHRLKSMKLSHYQVLDRALRTWLQEQRKLGVVVTGVQCTNQARLLIETLKMEGKFNAHGSWMSRFKLRHGIGTAPPARVLSTGHSPENASMHVEATYGESHGEFIVPMSDAAEQQLIARPSAPPHGAPHTMVLSDVRSLAVANCPPQVQIKEEVHDTDDANEDADEGNEDDVIEEVAPGVPMVSPSPAPPPVLHVVPQTVTTPTPPPATTNGPFFAKSRKRPAPYAISAQDRKSRLEIEVLLATKRKLEAEERRANAEAEFYQEEKRRSMALASLHQEERRNMSAMAELHTEERRKASSKSDLLQVHRNYYLEQQKTEVVRRRLLLLEIKKVKKELKMQQ